MLDNPSLIYEGPDMPWPERQPAPLILFHDSGGTTFPYHCLWPIGRALYGIHNPRLDEGGYWEDGIPGMASHYIELIETALPAGGEILLGGWSMGALLSLEVAWQMANRPADSTRPKFTVLGMIFIDSIHIEWVRKKIREVSAFLVQRIVKSPEDLAAMSLHEKVDLNMHNAQEMVGRWKMPDWSGREVEIPPAILMCATELFRPDGELVIDQARHLHWLGWDHYHRGFWVKDVVELDRHHFNIFENDYIKEISEKIASAADILDKEAI